MNISFFENAKTPINEKDFIARAKSGNTHAYGIVFVQYTEGVYKFFNAQIEDHLTARDLTEEVFFKIWQSFPDYEMGRQSFIVHIYSIAVDVIANYYRENDVIPNRSYQSSNSGSYSNNYSELQVTLANLPELSRYVLTLHNINKISFTNISLIIGRTESGVRDIHTQALSMLPQTIPSRTAATAWLIHEARNIGPSLHLIQTSMPRLLKLIKVSEQIKFKKQFELEMVKRNQIAKQANRKFAYQIVSILALIYISLLGSTGVVFASQGSIPGDPLYSAKLALEEIQLGIAQDSPTVAELHTRFALNRLDEISYLLAENKYSNIDSSFQNLNIHIDAVFSSLSNSADHNGNVTSLLDLLQESLQKHLNTLALNQNKVPESAMQSLILAMENAHHSLDVITSIFPTETTFTTPTNTEGIGPPDDILTGSGAPGDNNPSFDDQGSDDNDLDDADEDEDENEAHEDDELEDHDEEETEEPDADETEEPDADETEEPDADETEEPDDKEKDKSKGNNSNNTGEEDDPD